MSRHDRHRNPKYKVLYDSSKAENKWNKKPYRSRSRSPPIPRRQKQQPDLLLDILQGRVPETLENLDKKYEAFKLKSEHLSDPFDFTPLPVFEIKNNLQELLQESRSVRNTENSKQKLQDAEFKVLQAQLKVHQTESRLKAIQKSLNSVSN